ncbi:MAG TPA: wax ester/triacylglycerol synthase family O-acyltransferase [Roseiflexaceae bacterium]|nr:wax ester/triacylglycerol synthase family O-acyltransferase [Roseiflexaceae bacterium]
MADNGKRTEPLSSVDTAWLRMEDPTNLMMITGVLVFDQPLSLEMLRQVVEQRLLAFRRFRQRVMRPALGLGPPFWEDDPHFDIQAHLHRIALPAPGDQTTLQELVSDLMSTPLDFSKSPWQFHLIENYGDGSVLLARLHHCMADGIALVNILLSMTDTRPEGPASNNGTGSLRHERDPLSNLLRQSNAMLNTTRRATNGLLSNPAQALGFARQGAGLAGTLGKLVLMSADPQTAFKGRLGVAKRAAWSAPIPLDHVKQVGRMIGGTINDVLLTATTGALRRYLQGRGERVDGMDIRAVVPVNLRPMSGPIELGNRFGLVFLPLPVGIEDVFERLHELKRRMDAIKGSPEALVAFGILNAMGVATDGVQDLIVSIFGSKATGVMTNVPGPRETIYMAGAPIREIMFWVPQSGRLGLGVSILSYAGNVTLGIATDAGLAPDPETIIANFNAEFAYMYELAELVQA